MIRAVFLKTFKIDQEGLGGGGGLHILGRGVGVGGWMGEWQRFLPSVLYG